MNNQQQKRRPRYHFKVPLISPRGHKKPDGRSPASNGTSNSNNAQTTIWS